MRVPLVWGNFCFLGIFKVRSEVDGGDDDDDDEVVVVVEGGEEALELKWF